MRFDINGVVIAQSWMWKAKRRLEDGESGKDKREMHIKKRKKEKQQKALSEKEEREIYA